MSSSNTFGGTIKLQGESEYRKAITQITQQLKVMGSEMGKVTAEFGKNNTSTEALTQRNKILNQEIDKQKEKVATLGGALEYAQKEYGKNSKQANSWQISLNKAEAELISMQKEVKNNNEVLEENEKQTKKNKKGIDDFGNSADNAGKKSLSLGDIIKGNLISEGIIAGVKKLASGMKELASNVGNFVKEGIKNASNLTEVQNVVDTAFGKNAESVNQWAKAAATSYGMSELDAKKYNGTMGAMLKSMQLTDAEVLKMSQSMVGLAGDFASFYNLDTEEAFNKIRSGISGETEPLKQLGINMSVANLEAYALSQGIKKSYNSMTQAEQATLRYNYLMKVSADAQGDFAKTSDSFANQQRIAQLNVQNLATSIGNQLLPICNKAMTIFNGLFNGTTDLSTGMNELSNMVLDLVNKLIEGLPTFIDAGTQLMQNLLIGIINNVPQILDAGTQLISTLVQAIQSNLPLIMDGAMQIIMMLMNTFIQNLPAIIEMGLTVIASLAKGLADSLPTLIPVIVDTIITIVEGLIDNIDMLIDAGIQLILGLADGLINALPILIEKAPEIIQKLFDALVRNFPKIIKAGGELIGKLVMGIVGSFWKLLEVAPQLVSNIVNGVKQGWEEIKNAGKYLIEGLWSGISGMANWVYEKITGFANNIVGNIKKALGIHSPSTILRDEVGKFMAQGIGVGFVDEIGNVAKDMQEAIPTKFDVSSSIYSNSNSKNDMFILRETLVNAFKEFKPVVILNGKDIGEFAFEYVNSNAGRYL